MLLENIMKLIKLYLMNTHHGIYLVWSKKGEQLEIFFDFCVGYPQEKLRLRHQITRDVSMETRYHSPDKNRRRWFFYG